MRVRVQNADRGGCGMYRVVWPAEVLAGHGRAVTCHDDWPRAHWRASQHDRVPDQILRVECDADVVVLQRPMLDTVVAAIPVLQRQGVAVVVELDDDFSALPKGHPARLDTAGIDPITHKRRPQNRVNLRRACELADLVTCSTQAIADRYAPHGRYHLLPNCVPARYLHLQVEPHDGVRVGWTGSTVTHVGDLDVVGDGVARALDGAPFHVVGTGRGVAAALSLADDQVVAAGWLDIEEGYPAAYAALDVAIVPLELNAFNRAKSWLKGIEAAALGVPFIASPTEPYCELAAMGAGGLARTPDEWRIMVRLLLESESARAEIAGRGRAVAADWTVEGNAWRWAEAWERASEIRRLARPAA